MEWEIVVGLIIVVVGILLFWLYMTKSSESVSDFVQEVFEEFVDWIKKQVPGV